jgi:hypothetical protein
MFYTAFNDLRNDESKFLFPYVNRLLWRTAPAYHKMVIMIHYIEVNILRMNNRPLGRWLFEGVALLNTLAETAS